MNTHKDLKTLEEANYQSLDEKRLTIDAYLANAIQELADEVAVMRKLLMPHIRLEEEDEKEALDR